MSDRNPYEKLGVKENASFDEIQEAKKRLSEEYREDRKELESIDAAYDSIIMERLRLRQEGKIKVPEKIRFPEKSLPTPSNPISPPINQSPAWLKKLIDSPSSANILWPAGIFVGLAGLSWVYQSAAASMLPLLMAIGFAANVFFLNRKEQRFGRSILITLIGFFLGIGLGAFFGSLINSQLLAIGLNVDQFTALLTFTLFWVISSFLR